MLRSLTCRASRSGSTLPRALFFERSEDKLVGTRWTDFTHPDEVPLGQAVLSRVSAGQDTYTDERRYLRPDGAIVWALTNVTLVRDEAGEPEYFFVQLQDITGRKVMEQELAHQALHDTLTGLPNRALLEDRLLHGLAGSRRRGSQLGVMFLDIDQFKMINDSLGHSAGDDLLRHAAEQIAAAIRPGDTVARFGGDEFVVVCDDVSALETVAGRRACAAGIEQPVQRREPGDAHHGQPRHRGRRRTRHSREPAARLGCGDVSRQGARQGPHRDVRRGAATECQAQVGHCIGACTGRSSETNSWSTTSR